MTPRGNSHPGSSSAPGAPAEARRSLLASSPGRSVASGRESGKPFWQTRQTFLAKYTHGGHTAKHQSHETREVGEGHYHAQRSLHRGPKKKADNGNPYCACTPFSFDLQELDGLGCQF